MKEIEPMKLKQAILDEWEKKLKEIERFYFETVVSGLEYSRVSWMGIRAGISVW